LPEVFFGGARGGGKTDGVLGKWALKERRYGQNFNAINATVYDKLNHDFIRDIAPVASLTRQPNVIVVNPSFPAKTFPEFIAYAKANPGKGPAST
jgi:tripartite-type tricarboxylate transporter receptor subunit TctC